MTARDADRPRLIFVLFVLTLLTVLIGRIFGPSDIHDKSQPKTVAYTADVVLHGQWVLPRDMVGLHARKPPLYNWLSAPFVVMLGWQEWVLKIPALIAGIVTLALCVFMTRRMLAAPALQLSREQIVAAGWLAGIFWLAAYPTIKLIYLARPDMLLIAFLTGAWILATLAFPAINASPWGSAQEDRRTIHSTLIFAGFWLCVAGAGLTKGPPALLPIMYAAVAARVLTGRWSNISRLGWYWGLPLALILTGSWVLAAYLKQPQHFVEILWGQEIRDRLLEGEPLAPPNDPWLWIRTSWLLPAWFVTKFVPWSLLAILGIATIKPRRWFSHSLSPALLWMICVIGFFSVSAGKRIDYIAPMYPVAAAVAAFAVVCVTSRYGVTCARVAVVGLCVAIYLAVYQWTLSPEALDAKGQNIHQFVRAVRDMAGAEPLLFSHHRFHPVQTLLGRHQTHEPTPDELAAATWLIAPLGIYHDDVPIIRSDAVTPKGEQLGLYRLPVTAPPAAPP